MVVALSLLLFVLLVLATILLGTLFTRLHLLSETVRRLEREITSLNARLSGIEPGPPADRKSVKRPPPKVREPEQPATVPPAQPPIQAWTPMARRQETHPGILPLPPPKPSRTKEEWEALIGGKLLNRIGALALIIGVGFFLKYAFDRDLISEGPRVIIGAGVGLLLLAGATRSARKEFHFFAQGLVGAGISILYLSAYASFNFYQLVSQPVAFILMSAVTILAFTQAIRYNGLAVSLLGLAGGFLTPFLLSTGEANVVGLMGYITLLDIGLLLVVLKKDDWLVLEPLALIGTYINFFTWKQVHYATSDLGTTLLFLSLIWVVFHGLEVYRLLRRNDSYYDYRRLNTSFHTVLFVAALYSVIHPESEDGMALSAMLLGVAYCLTAFVCRRDRSWTDPHTVQFLLTAIALIVLATGFKFDDFTLVTLLAIEGLVLFVIGLYGKTKYIWQSAIVVQGLALCWLAAIPGSYSYVPIDAFVPLMNERALAFASIVLSLGVATVLYRKRSGEHRLPFLEGFQYGWAVILLLLLTVEINDLLGQLINKETGVVAERLDYTRYMALAAGWAVYGFLLSGRGLTKPSRPILFTGLWVLLLGACLGFIRGISYVPIAEFIPLWNERVLGILVVMVSMLVVHRLSGGRKELFEWLPEFRMAIQIAAVLLFLVLMSGEIRDYFERSMFILHGAGGPDTAESELQSLENLKQLGLSLSWLLISIAMMAGGIWKRNRIVRIESILLFGVSILKIFIYDLSYLETLYRIFSFLGLGLVLLAVSYLYQKYKDVILEQSEPDSAGLVTEKE
ncbi:MAG: DUF2339 domain-containing protein [Bacteroidota bacterium]